MASIFGVWNIRSVSRLVPLLAFCLVAYAQTPAVPLTVTARTDKGVPVANAAISIDNGTVQKKGKTGADGSALIDGLEPGQYSLTVIADGFDQLTAVFNFSPDSAKVEAVLSTKRATDSITVEETPALALDPSPAPGSSLARDSVKNSVLKPATVSDALPLIPGVIRLPNGELSLSGRAEHRSTLLVNDANVTDPSTGNFGQTVPIDSVDTINVLSSPFLAQYGGFSTSVVDVSTRKAGEKWNFELNDPLPEFRFRSWSMHGLKSATPRVNFSGPLIKQKLYFSESLQYDMRKYNVITLPFPRNQQGHEGVNSFSEIDYTINENNIITGTFHNAGQHTRFANLDFFNPEPVTPNTSSTTHVATVTERATIRGMLLESGVTYSHYTGNVWPQNLDGMTLTPTGNQGAYFNQQSRTAFRAEWREDLTLTRHLLGEHTIRFGAGVGGTSIRGIVADAPVDLRDLSGNLIETIRYDQGDAIHHTDVETSFYGQDHWTLNPHLSLEMGLRAEQQRITRTFRLGPRGGIAWNPFSKTVVRAGVGVFYDRVPLNVYGFSGYPTETITQYNPDGSILAGPDTYLNLTLRSARALFPLIYGSRTPAPGNFSPYSLNYNFQVEETVSSRLRFRASFLQSRSDSLLTLEPQLLDNQHAFVLAGNGQSFLRTSEFTAAFRGGLETQFYLSYVHSRSTGNLNEFSNYLSNYPIPVILPDHYATLPGDVPNRVLFWGTLSLPHKLRLMPKGEYRTGFPYSPLDAFQRYAAPPNESRYPRYFSADLRVSKDIKINDKYSVRFAVVGANLTNHFNPISVHANTGDPNYGIFFGQYRRRYTADFDVLF